MAKIKVYELAKELSLDSKDVMLRLKKQGFEAKNHMSQVDEKYADALRIAVGKKDGVTDFVPRVTRIPKKKAEEAEQLAEITQAVEVRAEEKPADIPVSEKVEEAAVKKADIVEEEKQVVKAAVKPPQPAEAVEPPDVKKDAVEEKPVLPKPVDLKSQESFRNDLPRPGYDKSKKQPYPTDNKKPQTPSPYDSDKVQRPYQPGQKPYVGQAQRPQGQGGQQRPQGQGGFQQRPQGQGGFQQRPQGQGGFQQRPQGQGGFQQRPQGQGGFQQRPQGQGGFNRGVDNKDGDSNASRQTRSPKQAAGKPTFADNKFVAPLEKPTANYRQEKKVFAKDVVFERSTSEENFSSFDRKRSKPYGKKDNRREQKRVMPPVTPKKITVPEYISLGELAKSMSKTAAELIKKLFEMGTIATINQELDSDTAILLASEFGVTVEVQTDKIAEIMEDAEADDEFMVERPPVVTVMGHVDHGKTSLLDAIRKTNVIATEAGGITQHIGAYQVEINGRKITFLDTPGHEAFTAMRARGAQATDIAILVVAADDGVMPQTVEAINHSKAANVPIIVAINKMDKEGANPDRVKQGLTEHGLVPEEWGGEDIMVPVSAKAGIGIETLLEMILLVAEVKELKADPKRQARGTVIEAELDKNRGPVATLLVQKGTLKVGDSILAGGAFGKVRAMNDDKGRKVRFAGPSMPVEVLGFSEAPSAGEIFIAVKDDKDARLVAYKQQLRKREEDLHKTSKVSLDDLFKQIAEGDIKELNIILKADVQGSVEAVSQAVSKLSTDEVKVRVLHAGVGSISESDIMLASASNAIIIGFNIRPDAKAVKAAELEKVDIRLYRVIYDATDDIKKAMSGLLAPEYKENVVGHAEVRDVIKVPKVGMIAGSYIMDGKITRNAGVRVLRDNVIVMEGKIESLRRFKDDVKEVLTGFECGIGIENFNDIKTGDVIEAFIMEEIRREI